MSKKKKEKADEPKRAKTGSLTKASEGVTTLADKETPVTITDSSAPPKPRRTAAGRKKAAAVEISADEIAMRAYYLAEHRRTLNLPGDAMGDWVEAERQLRKEAGKKSA
jgi:hypothetical protein